MTSKKKLKKKIKRLKNKVEELQDTTIGILWGMAKIINVYDNNMELIQKTFGLVANRINDIMFKIDPLADLEKE